MQVSSNGEHPSESLLMKFLNTDVSCHQTDRVSQHLEHCESCQRKLDALTDRSKHLRAKLNKLKDDEKNRFDFESDQPPTLPAHVVSSGIQATPDANFDMTEQVEGRFAIRAPIASGGMGIVYKGFDFELEREVAIKVIAIPDGHRDRVFAETRFKRRP